MVENGRKVLSSEVFSQIETHSCLEAWSRIAAREHLKVIHPIVSKALDDAGVTLRDIDGIAVTQGPGLVGALLVGISMPRV